MTISDSRNSWFEGADLCQRGVWQTDDEDLRDRRNRLRPHRHGGDRPGAHRPGVNAIKLFSFVADDKA
jgi:hypothetical protein